eukprot:TRINITY_DN121537_c0_g1_i1.p1 TRINITY_DN121537_c0_g1~~TRINITY_DN121537_c0_g1_i1.p1  ORF type:complete len:495 (-),score=105.77 TRINITY_DN121537_c0_g1_i1:129-1613(-)
MSLHTPGQLGDQPPQGRQWQTSVNIAIEDTKDFREDIAPLAELYSELATSTGRPLFECQGLLKDSGIDLMDCPLDISLKLRVRRKLPQMQGSESSQVLWHVVLPMPVISKHLRNPPYEWQTWIGMLPNTVNPDERPPDVMFTQSVHLISRPEFPKMLLRFKYYNPEMQRRDESQQQLAEAEHKRVSEQLGQMGKSTYADLKNLLNWNKPASMPSVVATPTYAAGHSVESAAPTVPPPQRAVGSGTMGYGAGTPVAVAVESGPPPYQDALVSALSFMASVREDLASNLGGADLPAPIDASAVLSSASPAQLVESHGRQLQQRLGVVSKAAAMAATAPASAATASSSSTQQAMKAAEPVLVEAVRMALIGVLDDGKSLTVNNMVPALYSTFREVNQMSQERAQLREAQGQLLEREQELRRELAMAKQSLDLSKQAENRQAWDKLNAQQRHLQQLGFDKEVGNLKQQLHESQRLAREHEDEAARLRQELAGYKQGLR